VNDEIAAVKERIPENNRETLLTTAALVFEGSFGTAFLG
jgi:hypothetical protein